ncbi:hypothetical protein AZA_42735 [Nitrospirillum viridazoti Y2]|uniref:Uncharacterized protein n=1 Tax=Nitrospirillum amazonense TaxID=28077 RepID=A0A560IZ30_9PROT|nr:hypothetical protein [Nitrospirillum amazonense]EGY02443.1 hypothetical protein AZA_42735 [Nitrospirillum amazonense Y2]TWB64273.1 hypothetical protein FBZ92_101167 [Nitrospirillum amazonense]
MATLFVARSANLSKWASDVGLPKNIFKVGVVEGGADAVAAALAAGWAAEKDWTLVKKVEVGDWTEEEALERLSAKEKPVDPNYYPRLKGAAGVYKLTPTTVGNHLIVARAMAGNESLDFKLKVADYANYLIQFAQPPKAADE